MDAVSRKGQYAEVQLSRDELLTLRHCVLEALEALSAEEFEIWVGVSRTAAEQILAELKLLTTNSFWE